MELGLYSCIIGWTRRNIHALSANVWAVNMYFCISSGRFHKRRSCNWGNSSKSTSIFLQWCIVIFLSCDSTSMLVEECYVSIFWCHNFVKCINLNSSTQVPHKLLAFSLSSISPHYKSLVKLQSALVKRLNCLYQNEMHFICTFSHSHKVRIIHLPFILWPVHGSSSLWFNTIINPRPRAQVVYGP